MYLLETTCTITIGAYMYTDVIYGYTYDYHNNMKYPMISTIREVCLN